MENTGGNRKTQSDWLATMSFFCVCVFKFTQKQKHVYKVLSTYEDLSVLVSGFEIFERYSKGLY